MSGRGLRLPWRPREHDLFSAVSVGTAGSTGYCPFLACVAWRSRREVGCIAFGNDEALVQAC